MSKGNERDWTQEAVRMGAGGIAASDASIGLPRGDDLLQSMISERVIPGLVARARRDAPVPDDQLCDRVLRHALNNDGDAAVALLRDCVGVGMMPGTIKERLITPVARALGHQWEDDSCDFVTVTFGTTVLQGMMREMRQLVPPRSRPLRPGVDTVMPKILLAGVPGENHLLGIELVADSFERAGWVTELALPASAASLMTLSSSTRYDVIALSVAADRHLAAMTRLVSGLRRVSKNQGVRMLVGGAAILRNPETGTRIGADATAIDAESAVAEATRAVVPATGRGG